jgi:hypothetical protein
MTLLGVIITCAVAFRLDPTVHPQSVGSVTAAATELSALWASNRISRSDPPSHPYTPDLEVEVDPTRKARLIFVYGTNQLTPNSNRHCVWYEYPIWYTIEYGCVSWSLTPKGRTYWERDAGKNIWTQQRWINITNKWIQIPKKSVLLFYMGVKRASNSRCSGSELESWPDFQPVFCFPQFRHSGTGDIVSFQIHGKSPQIKLLRLIQRRFSNEENKRDKEKGNGEIRANELFIICILVLFERSSGRGTRYLHTTSEDL